VGIAFPHEADLVAAGVAAIARASSSGRIGFET
jgi:hypothetical protein